MVARDYQGPPYSEGNHDVLGVAAGRGPNVREGKLKRVSSRPQVSEPAHQRFRDGRAIHRLGMGRVLARRA